MLFLIRCDSHDNRNLRQLKIVTNWINCKHNVQSFPVLLMPGLVSGALNQPFDFMKLDIKLDIKQSISQQILLVSVGLSAVLAIVVLTFSANQILINKNTIKETINRNRSFGAVEKIDRNFYERFGDVQAFAINRLALEAIDSSRSTAHVQKFINTMVAYYVLYDLMMVVDKYGKVVANNTSDKNGIPIKTDFLIGKDFSNEEWFRLCMSPQGPPGGAWYSDFMENQLVGQIYQSKGQGMAFTAPIKDDAGQIIGVWYNYASWRDVTQGIRAETEQLLQKTEPDAFELITDKNGKVIDSEDGDLILNLTITPELVKQEGFSFQFKGRTIAAVDHVFGFGQARGAYIYKGNNWWGVTVVPKMKFSFSLFFSELLVFTTAVLGILILGIFVFMRLSKSISKKVQALQQVVNSLSQGELAEINFDASKDEIGQMTNAVKTLINGLKKTSAFANEIRQGNLDAEFEAL